MKSGILILAFLPFVIGLGCSSPSVGPEAAPIGSEKLMRATLGIATSAPSEDTARDLGLQNKVRVQGRLIEEVEPGGPADRAGLRVGDVLFRLAANDLYSADDVADFLAVSSPGDVVSVDFKRSDAEARATTVTLGGESAAAEPGPRMRWQFAGLGQLPRALETARAEKKKVLVGLSGAET